MLKIAVENHKVLKSLFDDKVFSRWCCRNDIKDFPFPKFF